jgi:hypothetical protein
MSVKAMGRVWDADLAPNHKLVLLAYADAAEHDGTQAYPGWERMVEMTGYSRSQVERITNELIGLGVLERVRAGRRGRRAEFAVLVSQSASQSDADSVAPGGDSVAQLRATSRPNSRPTPSTKVSPQLFEAFYEFWTGLGYDSNHTIPDLQRGRINKAVKDAVGNGIDADEVRIRGKRYRDVWPDMERTPQALLLHWHRFEPAVEIPPCDECENRGMVWVTSGGDRTTYDDPEAAGAIECPVCVKQLEADARGEQ